jgi:hypothetical protein
LWKGEEQENADEEGEHIFSVASQGQRKVVKDTLIKLQKRTSGGKSPRYQKTNTRAALAKTAASLSMMLSKLTALRTKPCSPLLDLLDRRIRRECSSGIVLTNDRTLINKEKATASTAKQIGIGVAGKAIEMAIAIHRTSDVDVGVTSFRTAG